MSVPGEARPALLYLSPVLPATSGNGLAMRAGAVLRLLARRHAVTLVVEPRYPPYYAELEPAIAAACERVAVLPPPRRGLAAALTGWLRGRGAEPRATLLPYAGERMDVVHAFRLATLPLARRYLEAHPGSPPALHLDLDDVESEVHRATAALHRAAGRAADTVAAERAAAACRAREDDALARCDRVYVCSADDRTRLRARARAPLVVLPNVAPDTGPDRPSDAPATPDAPFRLLFVGTLGYWPNADAVAWLCREIVPRLERLAPRAFEVVIAGGGLPRALAPLRQLPRVAFAGPVPDVGALYRTANAAIVPIRSGGGTRIKVLEAFAHGRPVVATPVGVAGLDVRHDEHALVAGDADGLAACCARLMADDALRRRLAGAAHDLVRGHTPDAVAAALDAADAARPGAHALHALHALHAPVR